MSACSTLAVLFLIFIFSPGVFAVRTRHPAMQEKSAGTYVGTETCQACHQDRVVEMSASPHKQLFRETDR